MTNVLLNPRSFSLICCFLYEAAWCQAPSRVIGYRSEPLLSRVIELPASWDVWLSSASNDLLSVLVSSCRTPDALFGQEGDSGGDF